MHDHTNGHNRARKRLLNLQEQHNNLQRQLQKLKATHTALLLENTIMESLCESLLVLQLSENSIGTQQQQQQQQQPHAAEQKQQQQQAGQQEQEEQLVQLLTTEGQLLQQLDELQLMPAADVSLLKAASTDGAQLPTIAPAPDQMAFFKEVLARLPVPGAHK
jgi:hypothetical protein